MVVFITKIITIKMVVFFKFGILKIPKNYERFFFGGGDTFSYSQRVSLIKYDRSRAVKVV